MVIKQKVSDVAKAFGLSNKEVSELLTKHGIAVKSNSQSLNEEELNIAYDAITQAHQIGSLAEVFAAAQAAVDQKKKDTEEGQLFADGKAKKDHGRLYAPIRVIDRGVLKQKTEKEGQSRCRHIRDQEGKPWGEGEQSIDPYAEDGCDHIHERHRQIACRAALL